MIVFILIISVTALPLAVGLCALIFAKRHAAGKKPIGLLFHAITSRQFTHFSHFSPENFTLLIEALVRQKTVTSTLNKAAHNDATGALVITFDDGYQNFYSQAFPILETHSIKVTLFPIAGFIGRASEWDVLPRQEHLNKTQLREISDHGHEIGSHTMSHANLTLLRTSDVEQELRDSKKMLEDIIGKPVTSLSFPFGSWNNRVWEIAQSVGYSQATGYRNHGRGQPGILPVCGVYSYDTIEDVLDKVFSSARFLNSVARARVTSHFSKGTPLWKFRKNYMIAPKY
jgi:peptidoglycan/xylan/chitin deacetylase (PgdA/CDA1 family)